MNTKAIAMLALSIFCLRVSAQTPMPSLRQPVKYEMSIGLGLLPTFLKDHGSTVVPPVAFTAACRVAPQFSLGVFGGHSVSDTRRKAYGDGAMTQYRHSLLQTGIRAAVHTRHTEKWEAYGGLSLGLQFSHFDVLEGNMDYLKKHRKFKENVTRMAYTGFVGGRYRLTPRVGVFGELGLGVSLLTAGVQLRWH